MFGNRKTALLAIFFVVASGQIVIAAGPQYPDYVSNVLTGIDGIVAGTQQRVALGRAAERVALFRSLVATGLAAHLTDPSEISFSHLKNEDVLCAVRGLNAAIANDRNFLSVLSTKVTATATPGKIDTLSVALSTLGQSYSIDIKEKGTYAKIKDSVEKQCKAEINKFVLDYFGRTSHAFSEFGTVPHWSAVLLGAGSPVTSLISAIDAIVTPIVTGLVGIIDEKKRTDAIMGYLGNAGHQREISDALDRLSIVADKFAEEQRMEALGRFSVQMAVIRTTKIEKCDPAPKKLLPDAPPTVSGRTKASPSPPTDEFMACYAAIWKRISDPVAAAVKAADDYDQFADAVNQISDGSDKPSQNAAKEVEKQLHEIGKKPPIKAYTDVWAAALKLYGFAQTVNNAFSQDNRDKVRKAIDALVKAL